MRYASVTLFVVALARSQSTVEQVEAKAIEAAKNTNVHQVEPSLPNQAFAEWLRGVAGTHIEIKWEVNDCGEQTGDPSWDKGRDFPMCAEAQVALGGSREVSVSLSVGTLKNGVSTGPANFSSAVITESHGSLNGVMSLSRLREAVKAAR